MRTSVALLVKQSGRRFFGGARPRPFVNWGDGSAATQAYLMWNGGQFQIMGSHSYTRAGSYTVSLTVNDYDGSQATLQETAVVRDAALTGSGNSPVAATAAQLFSGALGSFTDADPLASPGDFTASINWGDGTPSTAATITSTGSNSSGATFSVSGSHTYSSAGNYNYTVNIQDFGGSTQSLQGTFAVSNAGASNPPPQYPPPSWAAGGPTFAFTQAAAPAIAVLSAQSNAEGDAVSLQVAATPPAGQSSNSYAVVGLPPGLGFDPTTGVISGTMATTPPRPSAATTHGVGIGATTGLISGAIADGDAAAGPYAVTVTTTYGGQTSTSQSFVWTIHPAVNGVPTLAAPANQTTVAGTQASLNLSAAETDEDHLAYTATGLPDGLSLDPYTGVISGAPAEDAIRGTPYTVTATVDDGNGATASQTFNWTVTDSAFTLNGLPVGQTEGAGVQTFDVATFHDPDTNRAPGAYTATITWGDGGSSPGTVAGTAGQNTVSGEHVYLHPGSYAVQVSVTDPAGATTSTTAMAAVASAPLTATGGFVDGALTNVAANLTVATFTDGNTYDAKGAYTATIDWGDGTVPTAGVVSGADGQFTVSGSHTYTTNGTYTVGVTVKDADGTTASTTSAVTAGDLYAGVAQTLTVASFTGASASGFMATINWGDGTTTAAAVTGSGGVFNVTGAHAYGGPGQFTVQVTVSDQMGHTITASQVFQVAPAPAQGFGGALEAMGGYLMGGPLALFTVPQGYGSSGGYTATTFWGDGTTSADELVNIGGDIWEAMGGHGYASLGMYAVNTLLTNMAGALVAATVSKVEDYGKVAWAGPDVVPGNSDYLFQINLPQTKANDINPDWTVTAPGVESWHAHHMYLSSTGNGNTGDWVGVQIELQFKNAPATIVVTLKNWLNDIPNVSYHFTVYVVQVAVTNPANAFVASQVIKEVTPQGKGKTAGTIAQVSATINNQDQDALALPIESHLGKTPAIQWTAEVTLIGPKVGDKENYGVGKIEVGFHQLLTYEADSVQDGSKFLRSSLEGSKFLDGDPTQKVKGWYSLNPDPITPGTAAFFKGVGVTTTIGFSDSPKFVPIVIYPDGNFLAGQIHESRQFDLSVAAATLDAEFMGPNLKLVQEARVHWSVNAESTFQTTQIGGNLVTKWVPSEKAGVTLPADSMWDLNVPTPSLDGLPTTGEWANDAAKQKTWTLK